MNVFSKCPRALNGLIPLTKVSSCRTILTAWDGSRFCGRALFATALPFPRPRLELLCPEETRRMIVAMIDANHISERLASLRLEMSDLRVANARYWSRKEHTALDKQASALRQQRLIEIKLELADMSKRCA